MITMLKEKLPTQGVWWIVWKYICAFSTVGVVMGMYFAASGYTTGKGYALTMRIDEEIPFIAWTWWIYFPLYICGLLVAVAAFKKPSIYYRALLSMMLGQLLITLCYFWLPSTYPRPFHEMDLNTGTLILQAEAFNAEYTGIMKDALIWFWELDPPNNTFPSAHVAISCLTAITMWRERNRFRWLLTATAAGVFITVHTAKQHYFVDAIAGLAVALLMYRLVFHWLPWTRLSKEPDSSA